MYKKRTYIDTKEERFTIPIANELSRFINAEYAKRFLICIVAHGNYANL